MKLPERITRVRQMGHTKDLPFDKVITSGGGLSDPVYWDDRELSPYDWGVLLESQICEMPNGEVIDMYHFFVGLDVLQKHNKKKDHHIHIKVHDGSELNIPVGQNYSIATWAGDIGAAVADCLAKKSKDWEDEIRTEEERFNFYFNTRAPESDLLGDIDAWAAANDFLNDSQHTINSLEDLLISQYGSDLYTAVEYDAKMLEQRKHALILFLKEYQFTKVTNLILQPAAATIIEQILIFSRLWAILNLLQRNIPDGSFKEVSKRMAEIFLGWLEDKLSLYRIEDSDISI